MVNGLAEVAGLITPLSCQDLFQFNYRKDKVYQHVPATQEDTRVNKKFWHSNSCRFPFSPVYSHLKKKLINLFKLKVKASNTCLKQVTALWIDK